MPGEWSINDNLAHLRASADVWGKYMGRIVAEDNPTFTTAVRVQPRSGRASSIPINASRCSVNARNDGANSRSG